MRFYLLIFMFASNFKNKFIMKIKSYVLATVFATVLFSCSKDNETIVQPTTQSKVLNFDSEKAMNEKIAEIEAFKKDQEAQIIAKLLQRNNLKAPTAADFSKTQKLSNAKIDEKAVLEDLTFYHTQKLKAIEAERTHFGFISIQSIADEVNSLKLVDNSKSIELYNKFKSSLLKNQYETNIIYNKHVSNIINTEGELYLSNKNVAKNYIKKEKLREASTGKSLSSGIVAKNFNNFVGVVYSADFELIISNLYVGDEPLLINGIAQIDRNGFLIMVPRYIEQTYYQASTSLACFVLSSNGYVGYPCLFFVNPSSFAKFNLPCKTMQVPFLSGNGELIQNKINSDIVFGCNQRVNNVSGFVGGNFAIPIGSIFYSFSGSTTF
jgi:hypothetical protein